MPQLNPSPWFSTLVLSWVVFLVIIPPKILAHAFPNKPAPKNTNETSTFNWNWPWQ
uniref:ATP synthase complex subunit 8 n=1 Tax=Uranoscopus cognatus TaxID=1633488 RepID=A0A4Y5ULZ8_9TELE|nr:ATP synthase F0 subunit 8 [Uranoscopus cognatus]QDC33614.1 ATP synthase F0 subunit 8 [Uranoscopus cognatus]QDC33627.1 ATP synthase F0 subunit 8 [Uranoscopus cognatus]